MAPFTAPKRLPSETDSVQNLMDACLYAIVQAYGAMPLQLSFIVIIQENKGWPLQITIHTLFDHHACN